MRIASASVQVVSPGVIPRQHGSEQDVSVLFWATQEETLRLFNQHLSDLQQRLEANGLAVNKLSCLHGSPPAREDKPLQQTLLNEKA